MRKFKEFGGGFGGRVAPCIDMADHRGGLAEAAESDSANRRSDATLRAALSHSNGTIGRRLVDVPQHMRGVHHKRS
jgi:hypothetical protein